MNSPDERDEILAGLLAKLDEESRRGGQPNVDALAAEHPDLADELRQLWATAQFADVLTPLPAPTQSTNATSSIDLPRTFGDFELLEEIGRGGMGVVYKARQLSLDRMVALKMILTGGQASASEEARFQSEIRAVARLDHPNIVPVYEAGEHEGHAYFSMRLVEGRTLSSRVSTGPLRPHDAVLFVAQISRAVQHAHQQGILHRDLKPSNVLIDEEGHLHITDFGLAKHVRTGKSGVRNSDLTATGDILGTPSYMAPEQISGSRGEVGPASDVYSLGVILYELLTGRPPFQAPSSMDTLLLVLDQDPVRPRLLNPSVDPDLELICLKCLQKDPRLRYSSAEHLAEDLHAFLHGNKLSVRSYRLSNFFNRMLRETPQAVVLENWGVLWMWHSLMVLSQCVLTTVMYWGGVSNPWWYLLLWGGSLVIWGSVFWSLRQRGGPVLSIERQVAHVWAAAVCATIGLFLIESLLQPAMPVLTLSPILAVIAGMVFVVKAGMLSGEFYVWAVALFLTALPMAIYPTYGPLMFGVVAAASFFVPGLKYHRQRLRSRSEEAE